MVMCGVCRIRRSVSQGMCWTHYHRWRRGEPDWDRPIGTTDPDGRVVLSDTDVATIRATYLGGSTTQTALAEQYGVSQAQISRIVNGKSR
jgi:hypothetical protein